MSLSDFGAQSWAGIMFGIGSPPATFWVALLSDSPGDGWDGTVTQTIEPSDSAYGRQSISTGSGFTLSDGGFVINAVELDFPEPVVDWPTFTNFGLLDDEIAGNLWAYGEFLEEIYAPAGLAPSLAVGSLYFGLGNQLTSIAE